MQRAYDRAQSIGNSIPYVPSIAPSISSVAPYEPFEASLEMDHFDLRSFPDITLPEMSSFASIPPMDTLSFDHMENASVQPQPPSPDHHDHVSVGSARIGAFDSNHMIMQRLDSSASLSSFASTSVGPHLSHERHDALNAMGPNVPNPSYSVSPSMAPPIPVSTVYGDYPRHHMNDVRGYRTSNEVNHVPPALNQPFASRAMYPARPALVTTSASFVCDDDMHSQCTGSTTASLAHIPPFNHLDAVPPVTSNDGNPKPSNGQFKPYPCPHPGCERRYKHKSSMKLHYKVHTPEASVCKECNRRFPHRNKLLVHLRSHSGERPYKCDQCHKAFSDRSNLKRHQRIHSGVKPFECEFCHKRYSDSSALVDHRRRKHTKEKPFECKFCGDKFAASSDLTSHLAVHSDNRPFQCDICNKWFKRRSDVLKHRKTHR